MTSIHRRLYALSDRILSGITRATKALVVPLATGMTLALALRSLAKKDSQAKYVLWIRIDQKACLKSITAAGTVRP